MKLTCDVIKDLLPLYVEKITSEDSNQLIQEHIVECPGCTAYEQELKEGLIKNNRVVGMLPLKQVHLEIKKRKREFTLFISLIVSLCLFLLFSHITMPHFMSLEDSGITVQPTDKDHLYINFSENVTSCKIKRYTMPNGYEKIWVEAWTSVWDNILGKSTPSISIKDFQKEFDVIEYFSNQYKKGASNVIPVYGNGSNRSIGSMLFPMPIMRLSFYIALFLLVISGILWFLLKKWKLASILCKYFFLLPVSYGTAYILLAESFSFYAKQRDYIMILITATILYGICIFGLKLLAQRKRDNQTE